jgi:hypothetical protein
MTGSPVATWKFRRGILHSNAVGYRGVGGMAIGTAGYVISKYPFRFRLIKCASGSKLPSLAYILNTAYIQDLLQAPF